MGKNREEETAERHFLDCRANKTVLNVIFDKIDWKKMQILSLILGHYHLKKTQKTLRTGEKTEQTKQARYVLHHEHKHVHWFCDRLEGGSHDASTWKV